MDVVTDSKELKKRIKELEGEPFITVDTEFIREKTYFPILCLIQIGGPKSAFAIDPLADKIDMAPLFRLLNNKKVVKVFHAAQQDIEIFYLLTKKIPWPLFDSQVAAQVLGYGESVGYANLVKDVLGKRLDKSSRFTDWSRRPLSEAQITYAISDVTYLRDVAEKLLQELEEKKRFAWFEEEMENLKDPARYKVDPKNAWKRFKVKNGSPEFFGVLRAVAEWREKRAQDMDVPRNRVIRDEGVLEIAAVRPQKVESIRKLRHLHPRFLQEEKVPEDLIKVVAKGVKNPFTADELPERPISGAEVGAIVDLLRVLLKMKCEEHGVAKKIIATDDELRKIAHLSDRKLENSDIPALHGWRYELYGKHAIALKKGEISLSAQGKEVKLRQV